MKIIHCCFGNEHYIDTWGYQQNLLPYYHAKLGYETVVLASNDTYPLFVDSSTVTQIKDKGNSYFNGPVRVERSPSWFHSFRHFQISKGLYRKLEIELPSIVFFHGCLNLSLFSCVKYKRRHPETSLFVDNHGDILNTNPNRLYRFFFFKVFWSVLHKFFQRYVDKYFGVTEGRCRFLKEYFHIKTSNVSLLPIGADVEEASTITKSREELRKEYGFDDGDTILIHGGKLDSRKGTIDLINAYRQLSKAANGHVRLVLFGKIKDERIAQLLGSDVVVYEWLSRHQTFELMKMADIAIWPIHHTTLIEDCVAAGLPYLIRKTETTQHLINSVFFLSAGNENELVEKLSEFIDRIDRSWYKEQVLTMQNVINYYTIAKRVVLMHDFIHD